MTFTLKVNARNDLHLPQEILKKLNLGKERIVKGEIEGNALVITPVDLEPRYSQEELEAVDRLHEDEKKKGWIRLKTPRDIDNLLK